MHPVDYLGLNLKNPLIVAAGPWSRNAETIRQAIVAGAAAVATETITLESCAMLCPRIYAKDGALLNTTLYSTTPFEAWEQELEKLSSNKNGSYVICTIRGGTPSELTYIATRLERWGADALELCPYNPIGTKLEGVSIKPDEISAMLRSVISAVKIPVSIRLPNYLACTKAFVSAIEKSGAAAISAIEPMKGLWGVDIERRISRVPTFGGYCGPNIFPITLATIATLSQHANCQFSAMGGIQNHQNVLECIMLGATTVQLGSIVMLRGYEIVSDILSKLEQWMLCHNVSSFDDIRGAALDSLTAFEDIAPRQMIAEWKKPNVYEKSVQQQLETCRVACMENAICAASDGEVSVSHALCNGCGLCASLAPEAFEMKPR